MNFRIKITIDFGLMPLTVESDSEDYFKLGERFWKKYEGNIMVNFRDSKLYGCERLLQNQSYIEK